MRVRPWPILIIAFIHVFAPIFNILWSANINQIRVSDYIEYLILGPDFIKNLFWFVLPILTGTSILKFRKWSYFLVLGFTLGTTSLILLNYLNNKGLPVYLFALSLVVNFTVIVYFLHPAVRAIYLNKNLRWWEQKPRFLIDHDAQITFQNQNYNCKIKNISEGGCFIESSKKFQKLDRFIIQFDLFQKKFKIESQSVYSGPNGTGVFFVQVYPSQNELNKVIDQLANQGYPLRSPPPKWQDTFKDWIKNLIKGKGLVPQLETAESVVIRSTPQSEDKK